jgi:Matrixin
MKTQFISSLTITKYGAIAIATAGLTLSSASPASALSFVFDYTYDTNNFFSQPARDALEAAADFFEARITDSLSAITPGGSNSWTAEISHPGNGSPLLVANRSIAANSLLVFAGGYDIPGSAIGVGGPGGYSASGFPSFFNSITRGQTGAGVSDVGIWGGAITFDTLTTWNFSVNNGPTSGQNDFLSVALHELGHLLGLGASGSWSNKIVNGAFTGPSATSLFGRAVPLESNLSHWLEGTQSTLPGTTIRQEVAMDPTITVGTRKLFTDLEFAALSDIGWQVQPNTQSVPTPSLLLGAIGFGVRFWSKKKQIKSAVIAQ